MEMHSTREAPDTDANKDKVLMCVHTTAEPQPGATNTTQIMWADDHFISVQRNGSSFAPAPHRANLLFPWGIVGSRFRLNVSAGSLLAIHEPEGKNESPFALISKK